MAKMQDNLKKEKKEVDVFRDTPIRYLGYANEVGEAFRNWVHVNVVRLSYVISTGYVVSDTFYKTEKAYKLSYASSAARRKMVTCTAIDTLVWQGLASVIIPGFTINRICALSAYLLRRSSTWKAPIQKLVVTAIGLCSIPFIIKPIDRSVDYLMENTFRKFYLLDEKHENVVSSNRP